MTSNIENRVCRSPTFDNIALLALGTQERRTAMSIQPPPIQLDGHKEKSSSVWQCIIKSNCCSSTNGDDEHQDASIDVEVSNTETKTCCVAKEKLCCTIQ